MTQYSHKAVLVEEVLKAFEGVNINVFLDGTLGFGGHADKILTSHREIKKYIGLDQDMEALKIAKKNLSKWEKVDFFHGNFSEFENFLKKEHLDGAFLDLGVSSMQLDNESRGFSFRKDGPLDMRMDTTKELTAEDVVNDFPEKKLQEIIRDYGEEFRWKKVVKAIIEERRKKRITTTKELSDILYRICKRGRIHPATLVFQALRIYVNDELQALKSFITKIIDRLETGGRICIISFHSLEDRIVKHMFRDSSDLEVLTKKPIIATYLEKRENKRARSAKLRVARRL